MNDLSKRIAALSPEQRAVFEQRLKQRGLSAPTVQVIPRRAPTDEIPLSFGQERFWFLNQLDPDGPAYNAPSAVKLNGPLNVSALEQSLNEVARRHEILRTTFAGTNEHPVQVVAPSLRIELPIVDLRQVPADQRQAEAMRLALVEFQRPFDLLRGPLVRAQLLRVEEHEHMLLVTMHHIITDGWSTELLIAEVTALYAVLAGGQPPEAAHLMEPAVQYADYAIWQRKSVQGAVLEAQQTYWRKQLAGVPKLLNLPTDRPRPAVPSFRGALAAFELEQPLPQALTALAQHEGVTLFILMLAAFNVLLHRWSGQDDIVVGSQISGRSRSELSNVMGFFANNLALRTSLADDPTFRELVQRVGATSLSAYSHQDVPIELLFQVLFTVQNELVPTREVAGVTMRPLMIDSGTTKLDLTFFIWEGQDRLSGTIEYSTELFDATTIERLVGHYQVLLHAIVADPDRRISTLPLLTEAEQRLLRDWNATEQLYPETQPIHGLIAAQAKRTPDAIAVMFGESSLTYGALDRRANQLAHMLRALGVGARPGQDALVGLCIESSLDLIVGALGILKAGGAYIPLDPADPADRLAYILHDAQAAVVVTQRQWRDRLPSATRIICLDDDQERPADQPTHDLPSFVADDSLACTIYAPDATEPPQGVMIPHGSIRNRLLWMQHTYHLTADDRVLQKTPFSSDASVGELFWPLLAGATLVPARPVGYEDGEHLVETIRQQGITTLHCAPSMLGILLQAGNIERCTSIRRVICSGEALPFELQQRFFARLNAELHTLYGPGEASAVVTAHACDPQSTRSIVPLGRPIANTQVYLLDRHLNPVPVGTTGELFIGGVGLSRGYLNQPALTAEMFLPHPFSDTPGARLYRTGDLARYLPDGTIEFLGRPGRQTADGTPQTLEQAYVAPRTPTEQILALIWAEVLEIERVGVHDNFFDLGGHSLRALLLLSRVRDVFKISLPLQAMFQSTTVAGLATLLIEHEPEPGRIDKIARLLQRIKGVSREELQTTLEQRRRQSRAGLSRKGCAAIRPGPAPACVRDRTWLGHTYFS